MKGYLHLIVFSVLLSGTGQANEFSANEIYKGETGEAVTLESVVDQVTPGTIIVLSEQHGSAEHHSKQKAFLNELADRGLVVSVGMEHLYYQQQDLLDSYLNGEIYEPEFLKAVSWGSPAFDYYRYQVWLPLQAEGWTVGLKAPRVLTRKIARAGLEALNESDWQLMPPGFELGNDLYFSRFEEAMGGSDHGGDLVRKYFAAQCVWDDTMAWKSISFLEAHSDHVFVILVGDFHASYGGGLPDRLRAKGHDKVLTISQVNVMGLTKEQKASVILPDEIHGPRGDYVWVSEQKPDPGPSFVEVKSNIVD